MLKMFRRLQIAKAVSAILKPTDVTNGVVIYGSQYSGNPATNAFDGNNATTWAVNTNTVTNSWAGINYGQNVSVNKATVRVGNAVQLKGYVVEFSADGITWYTAATVTGIVIWNGTAGNPDVVTFQMQTAKYWRVRITSSSNLGNLEIAEIKFEYQ